MLTKLIIRNFKRFSEAEIELGNPVVFVGPQQLRKDNGPASPGALGHRPEAMERKTGGEGSPGKASWRDDQSPRLPRSTRSGMQISFGDSCTFETFNGFRQRMADGKRERVPKTQ